MAIPAGAIAKDSVHRQGRKLLVSRIIPDSDAAVALPPLCIKCGAPATSRLSKSFHWHAPWVYVFLLLGVLPYAFLALLLRTRIDMRIPLCVGHRRRRRNLILAGWLLAVVGIAVPIALGLAGIDPVLSVALAFLAVLTAIVLGFVVSRPLVPTFIDREGAAFTGAGEGFLSKLP